MKLCAAQGTQLSEQLSRAAAKKTDAAVRSAGQPAPKQSADRLSISRQALTFLEEQDRKRWEKTQEELQRKMDRSNEIINGLENAKNQSEAMTEAMKVLMRCMKIASSIMRGDNVPPEDEQYLMEHDADSYLMAVSLRRPKDDPDDCDSVLEDEDREGGSAEGAESVGGDVSAPVVEAAAPASGGGEAAAAAE